MADSAPSPALDAQRAAHPDLSGFIDELQQLTNAKLYHQLTECLLKYLVQPPFAASKPGAAKELHEFFESFIKAFVSKFDKIRWVQILSIVTKPQTPEVALSIILPFEDDVGKSRDAKYLWQALKAEKLTAAGQLDEAKDLLDALGQEIEAAYEVNAVIRSQYHKTNAMMWKKLERWGEFYKSSILYISFTKLEAIPVEERAGVAFEVGVAALVADEYDFGELLQLEIFTSLDGSEHEWIKEVLVAYGEGKFEMYDRALEKHGSKIEATPGLKGKEASVLRPKMCVLALMDLSFRKPQKQRQLTFDELAQHCRVGPKEVEHLVMRAMAAELLKGKIDEVKRIVHVSWVKPRILDNARIGLMRERIDDWVGRTNLLLEHLEDMTPELLVS